MYKAADLSEVVGAIECLQERVHVAGGSLVLQTYIASVLPGVPAEWQTSNESQSE